MRVKTLVFRSMSLGFEEEEMVKPQIPAPKTVWKLSEITKEKIQVFVNRGLLRPKAEVEWKAPTGVVLPSEDSKEQVIFASFFEHGFNVPIGNFFRGLQFYYLLELVHLVPNSVTVVLSFIHLCEVHMGIPPHFHLRWHFFHVKKTGKSLGVIGTVGFYLTLGLKS
jgi:hypothetical protein